MTEKSPEQQRLEIERERLRLEKVRTILMLADYEIRRRAHLRANRSIMDRIDDLLFG